jgi:hypothetical protein
MSRGTVFAPAVFCGTIPSNFNAGLNCWESLPPSCESQHPPPRTVFAVGVRRYRSLRRSRLCFVRLAAESAGFPNVALRCSTKTIVRLPTERREYANMEPQQAEPESPAELLAACLQSVRAQLPEGWELREMRESGPAYDAELELTAPDGATAFFAVQTKMSMERRDVGQVLNRASSLTRSTTATAMVISRYLSASVREALAKESISYIDATGNIRIQTSSPLVYIADRGQDRDPWRSRQGRPRGTLKGIPASRLVRSLVDFDRDWPARGLMDESDVSSGATYRVLEYLQEENLVEKIDSRYRLKAWRPLIEAWSKDYGFQKSNRTMGFIDPRGISSLSEVARATDSFEWAFTGSVAASEWAPYAPARAAFVYVENISSAVAAWGLRPATTGVNVILAEPESNVAFKGATTSTETGLRIAAPSQVAVDLLTGPGRNPSEGVELLNWMEQNERAWRR